MLSIDILVSIVEVNVIEFIRTSRSIVSGIDTVEIGISPVFLVEKRKFPVDGCDLDFSSLYCGRVNNFMIVLCVFFKVRYICFELVDS